MFKVIELDIDPNLTGDSRITEIAWVEYPAIEQDMIYFGRHQFYIPPEYVAERACQAIKENEERGNSAGTQVGKVRAQQLCSRSEVSIDVIKRMKSYLERAKTYDTGNWDDNGTISYGLWGGNSKADNDALTWVDKILGSIENQEQKKTEQEFVYPNAGETRDDFISRCVSYVMKEGKTQDEALGQCYGMWEQQFSPDKVSFDYDGTLTTERGLRALENERRRGSIIYIISQRNRAHRDIIDLSLDYDIPGSRIYTVGSNIAKVQKVKELGIKRHYDMNPDVRRELGTVGQNFDYDVSALPDYATYPATAMTESVLGFVGECGCSTKEEFKVLGYIDGFPIFDNPEEAIAWGETQGCTGYHTHTDENGNEVYMGCDIHPQEMEWDFSSYTPEEIEAVELMGKLYETDYQKFEALIPSLVQGITEEQVKAINHQTPTKYYRYTRMLQRSDTRDFCRSIEGYFFRRFAIDAMQNYNIAFGHKRQPYSKWLWKGGPNCVHAWVEYEVKGRQLRNNGPARGKAGIPPMQMENQGYFSPETKRASQLRYMYDQGYFAKDVKLEGELEPIAYLDGFPIYDDLVVAQDASFALGCGGVYENIIYDGRERFQACSRTAMKAEGQKQLFAAVEEKRMIYTPLMIPRILIPRIDEFGEKYYVKFTEQAVLNAQRKYMVEGRLRNTNLEHTDKKFTDIVMVESWIVEGDNDKAYGLGFTKDQIPKGTWMGGFTVLDTPEGDDLWENYIKPGKVRGASVEGSFILNFSVERDPDYLLLNQIIKILKDIDDEC